MGNIPHQFQCQKFKGQGHQAALADCTFTTCTGRGHIVAAALQAAQLVGYAPNTIVSFIRIHY